MKVFVVMSNDFPDKVFAEEAKALKYCVTHNEEDARQAKVDRRPRIYYKPYGFEVE